MKDTFNETVTINGTDEEWRFDQMGANPITYLLTGPGKQIYFELSRSGAWVLKENSTGVTDEVTQKAIAILDEEEDIEPDNPPFSFPSKPE